MNSKTFLATVLAVGTLMALDATTARAAPRVVQAAAPTVVVKVAPPSGVWETAPAPAEGYVWSAGYFQWKVDRFAWTAGEWVPVRAGFDYRQRHWVQRDDGMWTLAGGEWVRKPEDLTRHR